MGKMVIRENNSFIPNREKIFGEMYWGSHASPEEEIGIYTDFLDSLYDLEDDAVIGRAIDFPKEREGYLSNLRYEGAKRLLPREDSNNGWYPPMIPW